MQVECKWCAKNLIAQQPQAQALHGPQPLGESNTPLLTIYFVSLNGGYIQMTFSSPRTPKWESQN
jgi:hypothetical protein